MDINNELGYESTGFAGRVNFNTSASNDYRTNEAIKTLRSNLLFCGADIKKVVITSVHENEGKSTVAAELAKSLSEINKRTLLIDADMRKSVILKKNLKTKNILGLSEYLSSQAELSQILYNTQSPTFDVIFTGAYPPNPVELLSSARFESLLETLAESYDYIIIDSPPLTPVIDAAVISTKCDGALLIMSPGKVKINEANNVKEQIIKSGCKVLGVVLNETDAKHIDKSKKSAYYYYGAKK